MLDVAAMRKLHKKVNLVPVIAKSDSLTTTELARFKAQLLSELKQYDIHVYQFPECDPDEDEAFKKQDKELKAAVPFAVSGSCQILEVNGRRFRGRIYPWGVVEGILDKPNKSGFLFLFFYVMRAAAFTSLHRNY